MQAQEEILRLKNENTRLEEILETLSKIKRQRDTDRGLSADDSVTSQVAQRLAKLSHQFSSVYLSEIVGGIKRATDSSMPWEELKALKLAVSDKELLIFKKVELIQLVDVELGVLDRDINSLIGIINSSISCYEAIDKCNAAQRIIEERMGQAAEIITKFESLPTLPKTASKQDLDNIIKMISVYKKSRDEDYKYSEMSFALSEFNAEDMKDLIGMVGSKIQKIKEIDPQKSDFKKITFTRQEIEAIKLNLAGQAGDKAKKLSSKLVENYVLKLEGFNPVKYLGDLKRGGIREDIGDRIESYDEEHDLVEKQQILGRIITQIKKDIEDKCKTPLSDIINYIKQLKGSATLQNLEYKQYEDRYTNLCTLSDTIYNKRTAVSILDMLGKGILLKPDKIGDRIAMLEVVSCLGELEKHASFVEHSTSWVEMRSRIYHMFDTEDGFKKYEALINNESVFFHLARVLAEENQLMRGYQGLSFNESGFYTGSTKYSCMQLIELGRELPEPPPSDLKLSDMKALQFDISEKVEILENSLNEIIGKTPLEFDIILKDIESNPSLLLCTSLRFKLMGEMFKFLEELDLKDTKDEALKDFYGKHKKFFEYVREKRGELAHSAEVVKPETMREILTKMNAEGRIVLSDLKAALLTETLSETAKI